MIVGLLAGCHDPGPGPLGDTQGWEARPEVEDPLPDHRPLDDACPPGGWYENGRLEIQMGICHYLTLGQPITRPVRAGDAVQVRAWHQGLDAAVRAEAHVALFIGDDLLWEQYAFIPSPAELFDAVVEAPADAEVGTMLTLHLHNHGFNAWAVSVPERLE